MKRRVLFGLLVGLLACSLLVLALTARVEIKLLRVEHRNPHGLVGTFALRHSRLVPLCIYGFDPPSGGLFQPRFVRYQVRSNGEWHDVPVGYCATGLEAYRLWPRRTYTLTVPLVRLINTSGVARVSVAGKGREEYWSAPFDTASLK